MKTQKPTTPLMEQYNKIKARYPDYIIFFRLGDFYEMFGDDAIISAPLLGVVLTQRQNIPMCGVPHHSAINYIKTLLSKGRKIAVCEQQESKSEKNLIDRDVVRLITPGTVWEENFVESGSNNFIVSIFVGDGEQSGFCAADISTGEIFISETESEKINSELSKIKPKEIILPEAFKNKDSKNIAVIFATAISYVPDWQFDESIALSEIKRFSGVNSWKPFGADGKTFAQKSLGGMLSYLKHIQFPDVSALLSRLRFKHQKKSVHLDSTALRTLEITSNIMTGGMENTIVEMLDCCITPAGSRLLKSWILEPLTDISEISKRHRAVEYFFEDAILRENLRNALKKIGDMERIVTRLATQSASSREIWHLGKSIKTSSEIKNEIIAEKAITLPFVVEDAVNSIDGLQEVVELIENSIDPESIGSGYIKTGYNSTLDEYRKISEDSRGLIVELEKKEKERTKINSLKIGYTSVFGYYIEITKSNLHLVPQDYVRKQTLANAERFVVSGLSEMEKKIYYASQKIESLEKELLSEIRTKILNHREKILTIAHAIATIDVISNFAFVSKKNGWIKPEVNSDEAIDIKGSRHPVVERKLNSGEFVPNDINLDSSENQILIITGPNMAGKSTYLRQVAILVILAQSGCFIPASSAKIGVVDKIFTRIGSSDNLAGGESTFMVEMTEAANILRNLSPRSLLILDEIGRGTSTFDGISIAQATIEYLHEAGSESHRPKVLFATHYFELTDLAQNLPRVKNFNVKVSEWKNEIVFLHKILPGAADKSYGIHVAKIAGIPDGIVSRSKQILSELRNQSNNLAKRELPREQMDFEDFIIFDKLKKMDINKITPLEAHKILADMMGKTKTEER